MENNLKAYVSDKFDVKLASSLSLFFYPNLFLVFAKNDDGITLGLHVYERFEWDTISSCLEFDDLLKLDLPVTIYYHEPIFTLVPDAYFLPENIHDYMEPLSNFTESPHFFHSPLKTAQIQILSYTLGKSQKILEEKFPNARLIHGSVSFLSYLMQEKGNQIGKEIILNYCGSFIYLAGFLNRELLVFNRFDIQTKEDVVKYILIMCETLKFERELGRVTVYGATEHSGITEEWGCMYFSNFRLTKPYSNQHYVSGLDLEDPNGIFEFYWQCD